MSAPLAVTILTYSFWGAIFSALGWGDAMLNERWADAITDGAQFATAVAVGVWLFTQPKKDET